jgi:hypothetical protein
VIDQRYKMRMAPRAFAINSFAIVRDHPKTQQESLYP